ncbi:hypothetical protein FRC04_005003 [Tulasnella sp. 424]|nr:hypothetical protein FRC04_005003 [Tulasnella sp. 424]
MDPRRSSEAFIKALKGKDTSTSKIELAAEGWHSKTLYLPGKHSVIADWVIQSLCDGGSDSSSPSADARHWQLLAEIITPQDTKSTNSWLTTILARRNILPVFASTILKLRMSPEVAEPFAVVYRHILPLTLPKASDDFILTCFWAPLDALTSEPTFNPDPLTTEIWTRGLEAFRLKFGQVKDKRRIISEFLDKRIVSWAIVIRRVTLPDELQIALRSAGEILLFGTTDGLLFAMEPPVDSPSTSKSSSPALNSFFTSLKQSLEREGSEALLPLLPMFLQSFTTSIQRSPLDISQILNRDVPSEMRVRVAATHFLGGCLSGPLAFSLSTSDNKRHVMETRLGLFQTMVEEGYLDTEDVDTKVVVQREIGFAISGLQRDDVRDAALEILTIILKLDFDLVNTAAPRILRTLSWTRTIQAHINGLVDCLVSTPANQYVAVSCGPLFASAEYAKELQQAIHLFLTPTQVPQLVKMLIETFKQLWGLAKLPDPAELDEMITDGTSTLSSDIADPTTALSLHTRLMLKVFLAIPSLDSTPRLDLQDLHDRFLKRNILQQLVSQLETASTEQESTSFQTGIRAILDLGYCMDKLSAVWGLPREPANDELQESLIRVLRLQRVDSELLLEAAAAVLHQASSSPSVTVPDSSPSSSLGVVVALLLNHIEQHVEAAISKQTSWGGQSAYLPSPSHVVVALVDMLLGRYLYVLEHHAPDECLQRLGKLLIRLSEIPTGSAEHAESFQAGATSAGTNTEGQFNAADVVWNTFASGEFWEMRRIRVALISTIMELTSEIDAFSPRPLLPNSLQLADVQVPKSLAKHVACYRSMLYFPLDYFTRASKPNLLTRGIALDSVITVTGTKPATFITKKEATQWRLLVRTFIDRTMNPETLVKVPGVLDHLVSTSGQVREPPSADDLELERVTFSILSKAFSALATSATGPDVESMRPILQQYIDADLSFIDDSEGGATDRGRMRSLSCLLDAFVRDTRYHEVDSRVKTLLDALHQEVEPRLTVQLDQFLNSVNEKSAEAVTGACLAVDGWRTSIKFRRWKGDSDTLRSSSAAKLLPVLSRSLSGSPVGQNPNVATLGIAVFRLLLEELRDSGESVIQSVIVCFMLIYGFAGENEDVLKMLKDSLSESLRQWPTDQYSVAMGLISDYYRLSCAEKMPVGSINLGAVFRLSEVLIVDSPEGTGKYTHSLIQQSLLTMLRSSRLGGPTDGDSFEDCIELTYEAVSFIERVCYEKSSFLRDIEVGQIFSILHTVLSPPSSLPSVVQSSSVPRTPTSSALYSAITNILITLVRNQRDLVRTHFPDFTKLLCLLLSALKTVHEVLGPRSGALGIPRSRLSVKSVELVQTGLPWWVLTCGNEANFKLDVKDARQLNRLVMSLTTKTFGKDLPSHRLRGLERPNKVDSLASSFSNYATFVLIAYIRTVTDSYHLRSGGLTTLNKSVRRELEEGISELCGMIGDNRRDWVYQSLTSDGRSLFKSVWARYEKHRYTGTG